MQIPEHPRVRALGRVPDDLRDGLLSAATALVVPSPFESLSIVLLEAWNRGVPAIVNGHCAVLKGQVRRADGGLYYRSAAEFTEAVEVMRGHDDDRRTMGRQGLAYVEREYRWPAVLGRVEALLADVRPA
jgi:glycosyltransferase involved in cell wall biosynthesis